MIETALDHIVMAGPDLSALVRSTRQRVGINPSFGGRHQGRGTSNYLLGLGGMAYLELIGPTDPTGRLPSAFGIDRLVAPRVVAWKVRCDDLQASVAAARARGYDPGIIRPLSRRLPDGSLLEWRLTQDPPTDHDGLVPGLIDWQGSPHPASTLLPEARLVAFSGQHPQPQVVLDALEVLGVELAVSTGAPALSVLLDTPNGEIEMH